MLTIADRIVAARPTTYPRLLTVAQIAQSVWGLGPSETANIVQDAASRLNLTPEAAK